MHRIHKAGYVYGGFCLGMFRRETATNVEIAPMGQSLSEYGSIRNKSEENVASVDKEV